MSILSDNEIPPQQKKPSMNMSFRQQLRFAMEKSVESKPSTCSQVTEDQIHELEDYLQEEENRKSQHSSEKQEFRNKMIEESFKVYKPIRKTIFLERKPLKLAESEIMVCTCKEPVEITSGPYSGLYTVGCGRKCLNRVMSTECYPSKCPCGERCKNRRFQQQEHVQLYPIKTEGRGWGLSAGQNIRKGQFIIQYLGEVYSIDSEIGLERLESYKSSPCTYLMSTAQNEVIDPARKGNMARFINHSCDPNCETQKWNVLGEVCVGIFAKKNIKEDEELTFDYRLDTHKTTLTRCLCGSSNCKQYLGLIPPKYPNADDWIKKLDNMKCSGCKKNSAADDVSLILCDLCNRGWHINCLKMPLKSVPTGSWICQKCSTKSVKKSETVTVKEKIQEPQEIKILLEKIEYESLKKKINEIMEMKVKLFWEKLVNDGKYEITVRGVKAKKAEEYIKSHCKNVTAEIVVEDDVVEIELKFEAIYLKSVLEFYNKKNMGLIFTIEENICMDEIYSIEKMTTAILTGRRQDICKMAEMIFQFIEELEVFSVIISQTECRIIEVNFSNFKNLVFPVEVRLCKEKNTYESAHPFYFYSRDEMKLIFIGKAK